MRSMIGKIASVEGVAEVIDASGQHRHLVAGDWLRGGDRVVTSAGAAVAVETTAGDKVQLGESQSVTLSAQLNGDYMASASDDAVHHGLLQQVLGALQSGNDAFELSSLLASLPQEAGFAAFAATVDAHESPLYIEDLIQDHASASNTHADVVVSEVVDLMAATGLPSEVALQQSLLKDLIKD